MMWMILTFALTFRSAFSLTAGFRHHMKGICTAQPQYAANEMKLGMALSLLYVDRTVWNKPEMALACSKATCADIWRENDRLSSPSLQQNSGTIKAWSAHSDWWYTTFINKSLGSASSETEVRFSGVSRNSAGSLRHQSDSSSSKV